MCILLTDQMSCIARIILWRNASCALRLYGLLPRKKCSGKYSEGGILRGGDVNIGKWGEEIGGGEIGQWGKGDWGDPNFMSFPFRGNL